MTTSVFRKTFPILLIIGLLSFKTAYSAVSDISGLPDIPIGEWLSIDESDAIEQTTKDLSKIRFSLNPSTYTWNNREWEPSFSITGEDGKALTKGTDYEVSYSNNIEPGNITITIVGKGAYEGQEVSVTGISNGVGYIHAGAITKRNINSGVTVTSGLEDREYTGNELVPEGLRLYFGEGNYILTNGTDYTYTLYNNTNVGTARVVITGTGPYFDGTRTETFNITCSSVSNANVSLEYNSANYDGTAKTPSATVTKNGRDLVAGTDYTLSYSNNTAAGTATVYVTGIGNYCNSTSKTFTINRTAITAATVTTTDMEYTGSNVASNITLTYNGKTETLYIDNKENISTIRDMVYNTFYPIQGRFQLIYKLKDISPFEDIPLYKYFKNLMKISITINPINAQNNLGRNDINTFNTSLQDVTQIDKNEASFGAANQSQIDNSQNPLIEKDRLICNECHNKIINNFCRNCNLFLCKYCAEKYSSPHHDHLCVNINISQIEKSAKNYKDIVSKECFMTGKKFDEYKEVFKDIIDESN